MGVTCRKHPMRPAKASLGALPRGILNLAMSAIVGPFSLEVRYKVSKSLFSERGMSILRHHVAHDLF